MKVAFNFVRPLIIAIICSSITFAGGGDGGGSGGSGGGTGSGTGQTPQPQWSGPINLNTKTGEALIPLPFGLFLHSAAIPSGAPISRVSAGTGVTSSEADIVWDPVGLTITRLNPYHVINFSGSGPYSPVVPDVRFRQVSRNSDGTFNAYFVGKGTMDYYKFNSQGSLIMEVKGNIAISNLSYVSNPQPWPLASWSDAYGNVINYNYYNNILSSISYANSTFNFTYSGSNLTAISGPGGNIVTISYSGGVPATVNYYDNSTGSISQTYTLGYSAGMVVSINDSLAGITSIIYGASPTGYATCTITKPDGTQLSYSFDSHSRVASVNNTANGLTDTLSYPDTSTVFPQYISQQVTVDATYPCAVTSTRSYTRNAAGLPTQIAFGGTQQITYAYNSFGEITSAVVPGEPTQTLNYDSYGRLTSGSIGSQSVANTYDSTHYNLVTAQVGVTTTTYDSFGRVTQVHNDNGTASTSYTTSSAPIGFVGKVASVTNFDGTISQTAYSVGTAGSNVKVTRIPIGNDSRSALSTTYSTNWVPGWDQTDPIWSFPGVVSEMGVPKVNFQTTREVASPTKVCP